VIGPLAVALPPLEGEYVNEMFAGLALIVTVSGIFMERFTLAWLLST
jgi:hypothetical protein